MIDAQKLIRESGEGATSAQSARADRDGGPSEGGAGHRHAGPAVGATDASRDAGERMRKGRATAAAGQPLYTCAGRQSDTTKVEGAIGKVVQRWCRGEACLSTPHLRECMLPMCE